MANISRMKKAVEADPAAAMQASLDASMVLVKRRVAAHSVLGGARRRGRRSGRVLPARSRLGPAQAAGMSAWMPLPPAVREMWALSASKRPGIVAPFLSDGFTPEDGDEMARR